jgi:hypothetical protein
MVRVRALVNYNYRRGIHMTLICHHGSGRRRSISVHVVDRGSASVVALRCTGVGTGAVMGVHFVSLSQSRDACAMLWAGMGRDEPAGCTGTIGWGSQAFVLCVTPAALRWS